MFYRCTYRANARRDCKGEIADIPSGIDNCPPMPRSLDCENGDDTSDATWEATAAAD